MELKNSVKCSHGQVSPHVYEHNILVTYLCFPEGFCKRVVARTKWDYQGSSPLNSQNHTCHYVLRCCLPYTPVSWVRALCACIFIHLKLHHRSCTTFWGWSSKEKWQISSKSKVLWKGKSHSFYFSLMIAMVWVREGWEVILWYIWFSGLL